MQRCFCGLLHNYRRGRQNNRIGTRQSWIREAQSQPTIRSLTTKGALLAPTLVARNPSGLPPDLHRGCPSTDHANQVVAWVAWGHSGSVGGPRPSAPCGEPVPENFAGATRKIEICRVGWCFEVCEYSKYCHKLASAVQREGVPKSKQQRVLKDDQYWGVLRRVNHA